MLKVVHKRGSKQEEFLKLAEEFRQAHFVALQIKNQRRRIKDSSFINETGPDSKARRATYKT